MKRTMLIVTLVFQLVVFTLGTGILTAEPGHEAGFITLEENPFYLHRGSYFNRLALRSSRARLWYVFQPADVAPGEKPLLVFFNGGPGSSTSCGLMGTNTGRNTVYKDFISQEVRVVENPSSWTRLGNLLYIDARTAGFSYSLTENPGDQNRRNAEFEAQNYNPFIDGADFIRVLLRFLAAHPDLQHNRVVIVGESYGGIRSTVMLHILLYYQDYGNGRSIYQDPGLVQEIQNHYNQVFPSFRNQAVPPGIITGQFGHQVLIQPALTDIYQRQIEAEWLETPGSVIYQLAEETGVPYIPCREMPGSGGNCTYLEIISNIFEYVRSLDRDLYHFAMRGSALTDFFRSVNDQLVIYNSLCQLTGYDVAGIPELYASARQEAYKKRLVENFVTIRSIKQAQRHPQVELRFLPDPVQSDESDLNGLFGTLYPWDSYCTSSNPDANVAFYYNTATFYGYDVDFTATLRYGSMFLENTAWVETFITNAYYDLVVYTAGLPAALGRHTDILAGSQADRTGPVGELRPGQIILYYRPGVIPGSNLTTRVIRFPGYTRSGHAVTLTESEELLGDVISWLGSTGVSTGAHTKKGGEK